jgi:biopolymer transport protein ExbD
MRKHAMPPIRESGINVTPLIDIVMCMIIFFMLVAKIGVDTGADPNIDIPASVLGTDLRDMGNTLVLNVVNGPSGVANAQPIVTALVNGKMTELKVHDDIGGRAVSPLRDTLRLFRDGDPEHGVPPNPDFKVIIRGDKSLTYNFLAPVFVECNMARVKSFAFDTKKP